VQKRKNNGGSIFWHRWWPVNTFAKYTIQLNREIACNTWLNLTNKQLGWRTGVFKCISQMTEFNAHKVYNMICVNNIFDQSWNTITVIMQVLPSDSDKENPTVCSCLNCLPKRKPGKTGPLQCSCLVTGIVHELLEVPPNVSCSSSFRQSCCIGCCGLCTKYYKCPN